MAPMIPVRPDQSSCRLKLSTQIVDSDCFGPFLRDIMSRIGALCIQNMKPPLHTTTWPLT